MATTIQIKRTATNALPASIEQGELVYVEGVGGDGQKLYVGAPSGTNVPLTVGGVYYVNMLDHTAGVNTADSAVIVDADKKIDEWNVDNLSMDGNTISSTDANGNILLSPNGTGQTVMYNPYVDATTAGEATDISLEDYVKKFGGKTVVTQDGLNNTVDTGVDPPTVTIGIDDLGIANVKLANDGITIGSTDMSLGETHTDLVGLTSAVVDNITIDGNNVTATTGNLVLDGAMIQTATGKTTQLQGDVDFGDGTSNNTVTFLNNCRIDSHVVPSVDGTYDLGTSTLKWRTLYADGSAFGDVTNGVAATNAVSTTSASGLDLVLTSDSGTVEVQGILDVTNNLNVLGAAQMQTTLQVMGDTTMAANATVVGDTTMQGNLTVGTVATPVTVTSFSDQVHVGTFAMDDVVIDGTTISTTAGLNNSLTLAPDGTGDVVSVAHHIPSVDATYDLGSVTNKWRNIFADTVSFGNVRIAGADDQTIDTVAGDLVIDSFTGETVVNDNVTINGTLDVTGATAIGTNAASTTLDIYAVTNHTGQITQTGDLVQTGIHTINGSAEIDNVTIDGNTISTALASNGDVNLTPDGTGRVIATALYVATGVNASPEFIGNYVMGTWDAQTTMLDGLNKTYDVALNTMTVGIDDTSIQNVKLVNDSITIGTDVVALGDTITDLNGITSLDVDTMTLDGNVISTTLTDQSLSLEPNGQGTVIVPSGYTSRTGFVDDSLVTKSYVDTAIQGLDIIESARVATTANIDLANHGVIDGVTLSPGDRVLVKDQSSTAENGVYVSDGTGLTRTLDADTSQDLDGGTFIFVEEGTNANNGFVTTHQGEPVIDTDPITWSQFSGAGAITAGAAMSKTGNTLDVEVDDSTIEVTADRLNVKDLGILNQHIADTTIDLTAKVTNVLPVPNGGTGLATVTQYGMLVGDGTSPLAILAPNTTAGYLVQNTAGTGEPVWSNVIDGGTY